MYQPHTITLSLSDDIAARLSQYAAEHHVTMEEFATDLINQALQLKKHEVVRIIQSEKREVPGHAEPDSVREIIHRQDEEITWLRGQVTRLTSLTPTTHVIKHEYPAFTINPHEKPVIPSVTPPAEDECKPVIPDEKDEKTPEVILPPHVTVDDVLYTLPDTGMEPEELTSPEYSKYERIDERTLRDSIGGISEEKDYTVSEAAAISGESESILLEYIADGFVPARREWAEYRIRGIDLRRYMVSR